MREIKFRIRDKYKKERHTNLGYSNIQPSIKGGIGYIELLNDTDLEFMQYTGLKDKNGKEVYEGDIINCSSGCPHIVEFKLEHGGNILGGMPTFYLSGLNPGYQWIGIEEVIGNIYENHDLVPKE